MQSTSEEAQLYLPHDTSRVPRSVHAKFYANWSQTVGARGIQTDTQTVLLLNRLAFRITLCLFRLVLRGYSVASLPRAPCSHSWSLRSHRLRASHTHSRSLRSHMLLASHSHFALSVVSLPRASRFALPSSVALLPRASRSHPWSFRSLELSARMCFELCAHENFLKKISVSQST